MDFRSAFLTITVFPAAFSAVIALTEWVKGIGESGISRFADLAHSVALAGGIGTIASLATLAGLLPQNVSIAFGNLDLSVNLWFSTWISLVVVALLAVVPWHLLHQPRLVGLKRPTRSTMLICTAMIPVFVALSLVMTWMVVPILRPLFQGWLGWLAVGLVSAWWLACVGFGLFTVGKSTYSILRAWVDDRRLFRSSSVAEQVSRGAIASELAQYRTQKYRLRYVQRLIALHPVVTGAWPGGLCPGSTNDAASVMLAQWEERLQKLD